MSAPSSSSGGDGDGDGDGGGGGGGGGGGDAPSTPEVARILDVDDGQLRHFVEHHPAPTAPIIMGAFGASPDEKELVAAWLDSREAGSRRRRGGERE